MSIVERMLIYALCSDAGRPIAKREKLSQQTIGALDDRNSRDYLNM